MKDKLVALVKAEKAEYPSAPFNPSQKFPELEKLPYKTTIDKDNSVYSAVREVLANLLDKKNFGTKKWNPLKGFVKPDDNVVIKPNLVFDRHPLKKKGVEAMISHASVIRPIIDYLLLATNGKCRITICDVPLQSAIWKNLIERSGLQELVKFYRDKGIEIKLMDLRYEIALQNKEGVYYKKIKRIRDPLGYVSVDLGKKSYIQDIIRDYKRLEITDYGLGTVSKHHNPNKNEYLIPRTILNADVIINVPKLKTHRKAGVTLAMKNLIGINGDKSWIAHHRRGVDEYPYFVLKDFLKWRITYYLKVYAPKWFLTFIYWLYKRVTLKGKSVKEVTMKKGGSLMEGNWYGNDTIWRTILDLNNIIFFADKGGVMREKQQRKYLAILDGIIGMEREGPMEGYPKKTGIIIGGFHPVAVDYVASYVMGFDYRKIHKIREGFKEKYFGLTDFKPEEVIVKGNVRFKDLNFKFNASKGWKGHIER